MESWRDNCTTEIIWHQDLDHLYMWVFQVVFPLLILMGIFTNILNLVVLTRPTMKTKTYRWLRTLAVVDLILCLLTTPVCLAKGGHGPTSYGIAKYYTHFGWSLSIGSQIISFYLMGWFAYDRYLAVCRHAKYPDSQRYRVYRARVVVTVVGVAALYAPTMVMGHVCREGEGWVAYDGYTQGKELWWYTAYSWLREILSRVVPAVVLTFCNVKISLRLKHLRSIRDGFGSGVSPARKERERRLVLLLFWVTALFYLYNSPVTVYYLGFLNYAQGHSDTSILIFGAVGNLLQMMGNVSNFVLYFLITPDYQRTIKVLLRMRVPQNAADVEPSNTNVFQVSNNNIAPVVPPPPSNRNGTAPSIGDSQSDSDSQTDKDKTQDFDDVSL